MAGDEQVNAQIYRATHALGKEVKTVPIKWNALKVSEATDEIEKLLDQAAEPLKQAQNFAREAREILNLPQYITQGFNSILSEIERVTGGEHSWGSQEHYEGSIKRAIERLRSDIPKDALQSEQTSQKYGSTQSLV